MYRSDHTFQVIFYQQIATFMGILGYYRNTFKILLLCYFLFWKLNLTKNNELTQSSLILHNHFYKTLFQYFEPCLT